MCFAKYFQGFFVLCVLCVVPLSSAVAQEAVKVPSRVVASAPLTANSYNQEMMHKYFAEVAHKYTIKTDKGEELKLREQPLMNTQNPERLTEEAGTMFIWETKDGRPAVLLTVFCFWNVSRMMCRHEFISLMPEGLEAEFDSELAWKPDGTSLKFTKLTDVQTPAPNAARRLIQMRQISKDFSGELDITNQPIARLTLLPTPIHRYEVPAENVVDGAIFSMAVSTDSEILLIFEARKESDGTMNWYWAAARAHYHVLTLSYKGTKVWDAKRDMGLERSMSGEMPYARQDYFILSPTEQMPLPDQLK